jgi:EF hand domain-containing protein
MKHTTHIAILAGGLVFGCLFAPSIAAGQEKPLGGNGNQDRQSEKPDAELKAILKTAEKATRTDGETERDRWMKELNKVFPGEVSRGLTRDDFLQWYELLAGEAPSWKRETVPKKDIAELFDRAALRLGRGDAQALKRDEFLNYARRFLNPIDSPLWKPADPAATADKLFRDLDRDESGVLEPAEWTESLRMTVRQVDVNRDGRIDRDEYRLYIEKRVTSAIADMTTDQKGGLPLQPKGQPTGDAKPVVAVRFGKLPPGLPRWFEQLDTDRDGQVALHEWRKANLAIAEYEAMDLNGDNLLTADEWFRFDRDRKRTPPGPPEER